jgi:hypothetical protein
MRRKNVERKEEGKRGGGDLRVTWDDTRTCKKQPQ